MDFFRCGCSVLAVRWGIPQLTKQGRKVRPLVLGEEYTKSAENLIHYGEIRDGVQLISESDGLEKDK